MSEKRESRTIGVFTAELNISYQTAIWRGIQRRATDLGFGVISFLGSRIGSPYESELAANFVYDLATKRSVDGLVVVSAAIATFLDTERLRRVFLERSDLPAVSVGVRVPEASSVVVDGSKAIGELVHHLSSCHGRGRFAVIGGPANHAEVLARRRAIRDALAAEELSIDPELDTSGSWTRSSGEEAVNALLDSGRPFDALFCMNDLMAIGAIRALRTRGRRVPEDVSVVGFDGIADGQALIHPLTSVVQPLEELGAASVSTLEELMSQGGSRHRVLECGLLMGESCGCPPDSARLLQADGSPRSRTSAEFATEARLRAAVGDRDAFVAELNRTAAETVLRGEDPSQWNAVLAELRRELSSPGNAQQRSGGDLFDIATALVGEIRVRAERDRAARREERHDKLRAISNSLAGSFEIDVLFENLRGGLLSLGVGECYVALFTPGESRETARLVLAPGRSRDDRPRFRTDRLLPPQLGEQWRTRAWVLEPLMFQDEPLGYMLLPGQYDEPALYDTLKGQVATAVKGALLLETVRSHERTLEREVRRRTAELTRANRELLREVERRVHLEREVVDISNRTMERIGQDLHDDLCQHLAGIAMLASVAEGSLTRNGRAEVLPIRRIGELLEESITRAKQIARGLMPAGLESHGLPAAIESLVENTRKSYDVAIDFRASPLFSLSDTDRALQIYRIVQEALSNAVKHSGSHRIVVSLACEGQPRLEVPADGAPLVVEVRDDGSGIPATGRPDGMGLRIMRYRAEKAGIELAVQPGNPGTRVICRVNDDGGDGA